MGRIEKEPYAQIGEPNMASDQTVLLATSLDQLTGEQDETAKRVQAQMSQTALRRLDEQIRHYAFARLLHEDLTSPVNVTSQAAAATDNLPVPLPGPAIVDYLARLALAAAEH
jgi:hypothetical protein